MDINFVRSHLFVQQFFLSAYFVPGTVPVAWHLH